MRFDLRLGDCADPVTGLASLPESSIEALVTDPPAGIGFMAREWDGDRGGRDAWIEWMAGVMKECLRALKPGAHGFVWALPRTSHWTATALEDAGFEIRDINHHLFGTGFPKSLDVSKAIDEAAGAERMAVGKSARHGGGINHVYGVGMGDGNVPMVTAPATAAAKQWAGWGTALKPAVEHWILVRKPLTGTVAANVQQHGTGALNIDAARIPSGPDHAEKCASVVGLDSNRNAAAYGEWTGEREDSWSPAGRWPANLALSHSPLCADVCAPGCPVAELDRQSGLSVGTGPRKINGADRPTRDKAGGFSVPAGATVGDSGGASRFFYCAKPARSERDAGCSSLPPRAGGETTGREEGTAALNSPRTGAGRGGGARNFHPTVKPLSLMEWLITLIVPPGGTVLDPFAGSGTTGVAAISLGFPFMGWEQDPEYFPIAMARLQAARKRPEQLGLLGLAQQGAHP
jgi:hypothetical protein